MNPHKLMRRIERTLLGALCIAVGCAALVGFLASSTQLDQFLSSLQSTAYGATGEQIEEVAAPGKPAAEVPVARDAVADEDLAPKTRVVIPPGRPDWVEADFAQVENPSGITQIAISSGPYAKKQDAARALEEEIDKEIRAYISDYLGNSAAGTLIRFDYDVSQRLLRQTYHERIEVSVGPMHQSHALLEFTPDFQKDISEQWKSITVAGRIGKVGIVSLGVLMVLSTILGYFKADTATRGYYTTRLQLGTATVILALVAGGFLLFKYL